jgi:phosphatidylserine decarboxylase
LWVQPTWIAIAATSILGIFYLLVVNFFRSPKRNYQGERDNAVVASADGKVVALEETYENEYLNCRCIQLSIYERF